MQRDDLRKTIQDELEFVERQLAQHTDPYDTVRLMWEQRRDTLREILGRQP